MSTKPRVSVAAATVGGLADKWLVELGRTLTREEFDLLKALYLKTLGLRALQDFVKEPRDHVRLLFDLPQEKEQRVSAGGDPRNFGATLGHVSECDKLTPSQSLALLVHRLQILVPTSPAELRGKDTRKSHGIKGALASLETQLSCLPTAEGIEIHKESNLIECVIRCYVNLTRVQQQELMQSIAGCVGLTVDTATLFEVLAEFIVKRNRFDAEKIVGEFVNVMPMARCNKTTYQEFEAELLQANLPHHPIPIPGGCG